MKTSKAFGTSLLLCVTFAVAGCSSDAGDGSASIDEALALANGAGAGPEMFADDPCAHPAAFAKANGYKLLVMPAGQHALTGTAGKDLIVGTDGDDEIHAGAGDDIVCAGYGEDKVYGGDGNDYLDGGGDNDRMWGENGNDLLHGRGGSDYLFGGNGDDEIFGDILDDHMWGDGGDDLLIGGHGTDVMFGGDGNDYMRGDTGNDAFIGGAGQDVASFMTAMPPGQPEIVGKPANPASGVRVDFTDDCAAAGDVGDGRKTHDGCANGDGGNEPLDGIEVVVGSPYDDIFVSDATKVRYIGGYGKDTCDGAACGTALPAGAATSVFVTLDVTPRDVGLVIVGTAADDDVSVIRTADGFRVKSDTGTSFLAGPNCRADGAAVVCETAHVLRYMAAWLGDGDDTATFAETVGETRRFPNDMTVHANGGNGSDVLSGGDEQDVLFSGPTGNDTLAGFAGDDALLSESRKWPKKDCTPEQANTNPACDEDKPVSAKYTDGADALSGGPGDDQLVTDYPCGKHRYSGGGGKDIAGFARSGTFNLKAQLAGSSSAPQSFQAHAFNPQLCDVGDGTVLEDDLEILEASDGNDELWGNDKNDTIWGRGGNDVIHGLGGDDVLDGADGDDSLYGGAGNDTLTGGAGNDKLFQDAN